TCHQGNEGHEPRDEEPPFFAAGACVACHDRREHTSTRSAHRALATRGALVCATCHPAHEGAQGVTFDGRGGFARWTAGASRTGHGVGAGLRPGTTVPLVSVSAGAGCHHPRREEDPLARCVTALVRAEAGRTPEAANLCFDEHRRLPEEQDPSHTRFVAWEAARTAAQTTDWVRRPAGEGGAWAPVLGGSL